MMKNKVNARRSGRAMVGSRRTINAPKLYKKNIPVMKGSIPIRKRAKLKYNREELIDKGKILTKIKSARSEMSSIDKPSKFKKSYYPHLQSPGNNTYNKNRLILKKMGDGKLKNTKYNKLTSKREEYLEKAEMENRKKSTDRIPKKRSGTSVKELKSKLKYKKNK